MTLFKSFKKNNGVTLVELLVVLGIIGLAISGILLIFVFGTRVFNFGSSQYDIQGNARFASQVLNEEVKYAADIEILDWDDMIVGYRTDHTTIPVYENYIYYDNTNGIIYKANRFSIKSQVIGINGVLNFKSVFSDKVLKYNITAVNGSRSYTMNNELLSLNLGLGSSPTIKTIELDNPNDGGVVLKYVTLSDYISGSQAPVVVVGNINNSTAIEITCSKAISDVRIADQGTTQNNRFGTITTSNSNTVRVSFTQEVQNNRELEIEIDFYDLYGVVSTYPYTIIFTNQDSWTVTGIAN